MRQCPLVDRLAGCPAVGAVLPCQLARNGDAVNSLSMSAKLGITVIGRRTMLHLLRAAKGQGQTSINNLWRPLFRWKLPSAQTSSVPRTATGPTSACVALHQLRCVYGGPDAGLLAGRPYLFASTKILPKPSGTGSCVNLRPPSPKAVYAPPGDKSIQPASVVMNTPRRPT